MKEEQELREKSLYDMSMTDGWIILEKHINDTLKGIEEYILNTLPKDFQEYVTKVAESKGRIAAYRDILDTVNEVKKDLLERSANKK